MKAETFLGYLVEKNNNNVFSLNCIIEIMRDRDRDRDREKERKKERKREKKREEERYTH